MQFQRHEWMRDQAVSADATNITNTLRLVLCAKRTLLFEALKSDTNHSFALLNSLSRSIFFKA